MTAVLGRNGPWGVALCGLGAAYLAAQMFALGHFGFPHDDAFIHLQFARNLFERSELAFNPGVPSTGTTSPLFAVLLAAAFALTRNWLLSSALVGVVSTLGLVVVTRALVREWTKDDALANRAALLLALLHPTAVQAFTGMESAPTAWLFMTALWLHAKGRAVLASALLGGGVWLRPELGLVGLLLVVEARRSWRLLLWHLGVWLLALGGYCAFHLWRSGVPWPQTFEAKALTGYAGTLRPWATGVLGTVRAGNWRWVPTALLGWPLVGLVVTDLCLLLSCAPMARSLTQVRSRWREAPPGVRLGAAVLVLHPVARALLDPLPLFFFQTERYFAHLVPLAVALAAFGWSKAGVSVPRLALVWAGSVTLVLGAHTVLTAQHLDRLQVPMAHWVEANVGERELVATHDIGAVAFLSRRPVFDTLGLVEPELTRALRAGSSTLDVLRVRQPAVLLVCPSWSSNQALLAGLDAHEVYRTDYGAERWSANGPLGPFVAYRLEWPR